LTAGPLRLGTRGSALALAQAEAVAELLGGAEVVPVSSRDGEAGDKSRFVRGVEEALLDGEVELGVHSAKDLPGELPGGLKLVGVPAREDPADAYVGDASSLDEIPEGARIGTSSLRRRAQLLAIRPDLDVVELRGNVDTRLRKLADGECDGIVLALAGLRRLGRESEAAFSFGVEDMTPAPGQGALALEGREGEDELDERAGAITDRSALVELTAERAVVGLLGASCHTPFGVVARLGDGELRMEGFAGMPDGSSWVRDAVTGDPDQPVAVGNALAERMLGAGAATLLAQAQAEAAAR
jgi:hydroxymethylbilane synthase